MFAVSVKAAARVLSTGVSSTTLDKEGYAEYRVTCAYLPSALDEQWAVDIGCPVPACEF